MPIIFYGISSLLYVLGTIPEKKRFFNSGYVLLWTGFFYSIGFTLLLNGPSLRFFEALGPYGITASILAALFLILNRFYSLKALGVFIAPVLLILQTLATVLNDPKTHQDWTYSAWAWIHIIFTLFSFPLFVLAFVLALVFLLQEYQLKHKKMSLVFDRLPSLDALDRLHGRALLLGFIFLTLVLLSGSAWAYSSYGLYFFGGPKQWAALVAWFVYAIILQVRVSAGWRGRKEILLSILGFLVVVFTFLEVRHL